MICILPAYGFSIADARFSLAMARDELPKSHVDKDGNQVTIAY